MEVTSEEEPAGQRTRERYFQAERTINTKALRREQACSRHKDKNEQHTNKIREFGRKQIKRSFVGFNKVYEFYSKCDSKQVESF